MRTLTIATLLCIAFPAAAADPFWLAEARTVAGSMPPKRVAMLTQEIDKGGPENASVVCSEKAPQMARAASEATGWAIRRVNLKNRNPKAVPDARERAALEDFDRRAAAGEAPTTLEKYEVVREDGRDVHRHMKALPVQEPCGPCHGPVERLSSAVQSALKARYPDDKATGHTPGQIRGAVTIRKPG